MYEYPVIEKTFISEEGWKDMPPITKTSLLVSTIRKFLSVEHLKKLRLEGYTYYKEDRLEFKKLEIVPAEILGLKGVAIQIEGCIVRD